MRYTTLLGAMLLVALLLTACGAAPSGTGVPTQLEPIATAAIGTATGLAEPAATNTVEATSTADATASPAVVSTQAGTSTGEASVPVTGETTIRATLSDTHGPILVTGDGVAVYMFRNDTQNGDASACTDTECTTEWPAVTTTGAPVAGAGVVQNLLGTITREDGTMQVTYNGWPLYYYAGDHGAGSTSGHAVEGVWFLVDPSGNSVPE